MHLRRPARVPSLSLVLPHPPLPRLPVSRPSSPKSPKTPGDQPPPPLFRTGPVTPRTSVDSWNSSNCDGEDEIEYEWTQEQVAVLIKTFDNLPSHLLTPYGAIPPSNLLDKIARTITRTTGALEWPHSVRATRIKLLQLSRARAKESRMSHERRAFDIPEDEVLQATTNMPKRKLNRRSSMDFLNQTLIGPDQIVKVSKRLQRADRVFSNPNYHPYSRPVSRASSPVNPRPFSYGDTPHTPTTPESQLRVPKRTPRLRRSATMMTNLTAAVPLNVPVTANSRIHAIKRSESCALNNLQGPGRSLKRAPSFSTASIKSLDSNRMSIDEKENGAHDSPSKNADSHLPSEEDEKARPRKAKKQRTNPPSPTPQLDGQVKPPMTPKLASATPKLVQAKKASKTTRSASIFGAELPHPQQEPAPPAPIPSPLVSKSMEEMQSSPKKTLKRTKTTAFPPRPSRRIIFGCSSPTPEVNKGFGLGLESAIQLD